MTETPTPRARGIARDLVDLLIELSIGVQRFVMYPPGHPSLEGIVDDTTRHLEEVLAERGTLAAGVAYRQLVVGGVATDPRHPVISDLARRLHDHQLGAVSFERGITSEEVAGLLRTLAREPDAEGPPLGVLPEDGLPGWPHAKLHRVGYDHLRLKEGGGGGAMDRSSQLWLGLAQVSLATEEPLTEVPDATTVARSIRGHRREEAYDQAVVGYLLQLADELKEVQGDESAEVRRRVSRLIGELDEATLSRLVDFGGDVERRRRFVLDANQSLTAESVVKVLRAAASTSQQNISHSMTRLLTKLAVHARGQGGRVRAEAESALRSQVEELMADWSLDDPNPDAYTMSLDAMARAVPLLGGEPGSKGSLAGAERLVEMAVEIDAWGPIVERAVDELAGGSATRRLLRVLGEAPVGNQVAERAWSRLATPDELLRLARDPGTEAMDVRAVAERMGASGARALLDALADADDRTIRRRTFDVLTALPAPEVIDGAIHRLGDSRWFVVRNMLALLLHLRAGLEGIDLEPYATHDDPRVRREALALMMTRPDGREAAIVMALEEDDERAVRLALKEIGDDAPAPVLGALISEVLLDGARSDELRSAAVKAVAGSRSPDVVAGLVASVTAGRTILGRTKLAAPTPAVVEALRVLATRWRHDEGAREVVELARRSRDPRALEAVEARVVDEPTEPSEGAP